MNHPHTPLRKLDGATYAALLLSGQLWAAYPEATGDYKADTRPMDLSELYEAMAKTYSTFARDDADKLIDKLYTDHFQKAIEAEGFNPAQAGIINGEAYDRGHSAGCQEIIGCAMNLCTFAKALLAAK